MTMDSMLRSLLLLCSSIPLLAIRNIIATDLEQDKTSLAPWFHSHPVWYGTKQFEEEYAKYGPLDGEAACFCKKVESMSECPSRKGKDVDAQKHPIGFRWFHPNETSGDSKPHLCCKLSTSKSWDWVGFRYERQMSLHLCMSELRPVQPNVCCRVRDDLNSMAFHIRQARSEGYMRAYYGKGTYFGKSSPFVHIDDISSATDYDGQHLSATSAQEFVRKSFAGIYYYHKLLESRQNLTCSESFETLEDEASSKDCRLRAKPTSQCCCLQATLYPAERCFAVDTSTNITSPVILTGEYFEQRAWKGKDRKGVVLQEGKITWPSFTNPESLEKISPTSLSSVDPEAKDIGSNVLFDWVVQRKQWEKKCVKHQQVAEVERFKTAWEQTRYRQKHVETCISEKYIRYCPSGQALFKKLMPPGTCLKEPGKTEDKLHLKDLGDYSFKCPDNYVASTDHKIANQKGEYSWKCQCETTC